MSFKAVSEILQSDIKVNIFLEDETKKHYDTNKSYLEESKHVAITSKEAGNNEVSSKEDRVDEDIEKGVRVSDEERRKPKETKTPRNQQTTWVQYNTGYGGYGGGGYGGGGYERHGAPLHYDPQSRNYFVKFVFMIVLIMLIITAAFTTFVLATPDIKELFQENNLLFLVLSIGIVLPLNYIMFCSECARRPPCNFVCLFLAVVGMSLLTATITCRYRTNIVLYAVLATLAVVAVCVMLACTSFDFTAWYLYVVGVCVAFAVIATIVSVTMLAMGVRYKPLHLGLLFIGTILNVIVLIMELQMILGGGKVEIGESDYTLAAYMLYTSIIDIFLKIVQIMGMMDE